MATVHQVVDVLNEAATVAEMRDQVANANQALHDMIDGSRLADAKIERLKGAIRSIIEHWNEFGPECGFEEILERARQVLINCR